MCSNISLVLWWVAHYYKGIPLAHNFQPYSDNTYNLLKDFTCGYWHSRLHSNWRLFMVGNQKQALSVEPVSFSGDSNDYRNFVQSDKS